MPTQYQIQALYERIASRLLEIKYFYRQVPPELKNLITKEELENIYSYLTTYRVYLTYKLHHTFPFHLDKLESKLTRTLTFIEGPSNNEIYLMLETKSKTTSGKDFSTPIFFGAAKKVKPAWRIDVFIPEPYANAVTYVKTELDEISPKTEIALSQKIHWPEPQLFVSLILDGGNFTKKGPSPQKALQNNKPFHLLYKSKISLYSKWAN